MESQKCRGRKEEVKKKQGREKRTIKHGDNTGKEDELKLNGKGT